jgi:pimeloyl-ACP methyl ester carboxylesterase
VDETDEERRDTGVSRKRRRWWRVAGAAAVVALVAALALRDTAPVGHFTSAQGRDEFVAAYDRAMRELPEPDATLDVRTGFGVVRVYRFDGAAPGAAPLVLLPGRASASPVWADNLPSLLALRTVYTIDLLGEPGASVQDRPVEDDDDQAAWLHETLAALPEPEVHLLGMSIGGWTATNLVVRRPDKIASVVLLDPVATFSDVAFAAVVRSLPASVPWFPTSWREDFASWTAGGAPVEDVPVAVMIEAGMRHYSLDLPAPSRFGDEQLSSVDVPVLVILAGRSVMHDSAEVAEAARRTLRHGTVLVHDDASHAINGERPDEIAADVGRFLDGLA